MAKCKACGGSGKIEEKEEKKSSLPRPQTSEDSKHKQNLARKRKEERYTAILHKERKSHLILEKMGHKQNIESKPKNYKPLKSYRTKAK